MVNCDEPSTSNLLCLLENEQLYASMKNRLLFHDVDNKFSYMFISGFDF